MIYNSFFGFSEEPFGVTPDPKFFYMSRKHEEAIAHISFGINENRGFVMLTGEIGSGKTTVIRYFLENLDKKTHTSLILNPMVEPLDLLKLITHDFGIRYSGNTYKDLMDSLNNFLIKCFEKDEKTILIIDEAQEMSMECLEFIRLLSNLETDTHKLLQVILVGQPELKELISSERLRQLDQRVAVRYHLEPLDEADVSGYIKHRLKVAGSLTVAFPKKGITSIYRASHGIPRLINLCSDRSLMQAYAEGRQEITTKAIKTALKELSIEEKPSPLLLKPAFVGPILFLIAVLIALLIVSKETGIKSPVPIVNTAHIANTSEVKEEKTSDISIVNDIFMTSNSLLVEETSILNLLTIWGEKNLKTEKIMDDIKNRGYLQYEFKDPAKIMNFNLPVIILLKDKSVVLKLLVGKNALIIDPTEGKKILTFSEIKDKITTIKLFYKSKYTGEKADIETRIMRSIDANSPRLVL
ncbi:MAG: AAA family ATPase [Nitrospirae bacterium]|nr:AAA family ATPase [Nitrospirota bacterium]